MDMWKLSASYTSTFRRYVEVRLLHIEIQFHRRQRVESIELRGLGYDPCEEPASIKTAA